VTSYNSGTGSITVVSSFDVVGSGNTQGTWNINLQGNTGATGPVGTSGTSGVTGPAGTSGTSGTSGVTGPTGDTGPTGPQGATGPSGSGADLGTFGPTGAIATGVTGIGITGAGVSSTSHSNGITTYTISGGGSSTTTGVYSIKLEFSGGNLISSPFLAATDPAGNSLIGATGWVFARDSNSQITITHPTSKWFVNFNRFGLQTAGGTEWVSAAISGANFSGNVVKNFTNRTQFSILGLATAFTGIAGTGTSYMFITWQEPPFDFYS
jgi:hypothetical protein